MLCWAAKRPGPDSHGRQLRLTNLRQIVLKFTARCSSRSINMSGTDVFIRYHAPVDRSLKGQHACAQSSNQIDHPDHAASAPTQPDCCPTGPGTWCLGADGAALHFDAG